MKASNCSLLPELNVEYNIFHSRHSQERTNHRGISKCDIQTALNYSESIFKQGLIFHVVKDKLLPSNLPLDLKHRIQNLVIVMAGDEGKIITSYRSKNGLNHIKRKSKRLEKYATEFGPENIAS